MCIFRPIKDCRTHFIAGRHAEQAEPGLLVNARLAHRHYAYAMSILVRVAAAAAGVFLLLSTPSPLIALTLGALISLPTAMMALGGTAMYLGYLDVIASLANGSFATLGLGLVTLAAGYYCIQRYNVIQCGLIENRLPEAPLLHGI